MTAIIRNFLPALAWAFTILVLSLSSSSGRSVQLIPHLDKLGHFTFYAILTLLFLWGLHKQYENVYFRWNIKLTIVLVSLYGIIIEFLQHFFTLNRHFDLLDIFANITGCMMTIWGVIFYKKYYYENT